MIISENKPINEILGFLKNAEKFSSSFFIKVVPTVHSSGYLADKCFGYVFSENGTQIVYTGDTSTIEPFRNYITEGSSLYVDISVHYGKVHLKLDTGMSRIGFDCRSDSLDGIDDAIKAANLDGFEIEGIFTHFAVSDRNADQEDGFTSEQYNRFCKAINVLKSHNIDPEYKHCCNSAALCQDNDKHLNMCRAGIILYGLTPSADLHLQQDFIPVMSFKSVVSQVKVIKQGDTVSYGRTFKANKDITVATVSAGYADGYSRLLSNKAEVIINGRRAKIIGRVCMDQFCIDVTNIPDVKRGDEVSLFGDDLPVEELAEIIGTINYELVCAVSSRVKRIKKEQ